MNEGGEEKSLWLCRPPQQTSTLRHDMEEGLQVITETRPLIQQLRGTLIPLLDLTSPPLSKLLHPEGTSLKKERVEISCILRYPNKSLATLLFQMAPVTMLFNYPVCQYVVGQVKPGRI